MNNQLKEIAVNVGNKAAPKLDCSAYRIIRRNGDVMSFEPVKIAIAITKAFLAVTDRNPDELVQIVSTLTEHVVNALMSRRPEGGHIHIEDVQDLVEISLYRAEYQSVAEEYRTYRQRRIAERNAQGQDESHLVFEVKDKDQRTTKLYAADLKRDIEAAAVGLQDVNVNTVVHETLRNIFNGITVAEVNKAVVMAARTQIENEPQYDSLVSRLQLRDLAAEVFGSRVDFEEMRERYTFGFKDYIRTAIKHELANPVLAEYDLNMLARALEPVRDLNLSSLSMSTLYDRYFLHIDGRRIEMPQYFFMRVAMGMARNEIDRNFWAIKFYQKLSSFDYMSSTPTLFNAGTLREQLSSCYVSTVGDDLDAIYEAIKENALLSKFAGGLGNDWTQVRAMGAHIKGTNGKSQGVIPFLKVVNDTAVAVNQGGKRKGAVCAYLETWHADIEEFLELRKNTGDDRRRTHDMNTANWIPDLFMERVIADGVWSLFSPDEVPGLHDAYGRKFRELYEAYEARGRNGELRVFKEISAKTLWRKMLTMLFETGHPWITFKDVCNIRSPQDHAGVVHSSNLCTEITLNNDVEGETAVCNLGSVNLARHIRKNEDGQWVIYHDKLRDTVRTAVRMLDNVIDINFYPVDKARNSNLRHRPVGLGQMGHQDALLMMGLPFDSPEALEFGERMAEAISYYAIEASIELARVRGAYSTFQGSKWSKGLMPHDTLALLAEERGTPVLAPKKETMDWSVLREDVRKYGIRNSNLMAIAPTATIANICDVVPSIEPLYQVLYVKSNLSGEFTVINKHLVTRLKELGLWDADMVKEIKRHEGSIARIDRIPAELRDLFRTSFEVDPLRMVDGAARRQFWIDQAISLNLYMAQASGKRLDELYTWAWTTGLKTTYYLRTLGATSAEKSTGTGGELNAVPTQPEPKFCSIDNPDCEACQ